jgi:hypothetical protein
MGLTFEKLIGLQTWNAAWTAPITLSLLSGHAAPGFCRGPRRVIMARGKKL